MKRKRYTTENKIRILREAQSNDRTIHDVCRERRIKELQRENTRLKRMLADEMLGKELLKEVLEKKL